MPQSTTVRSAPMETTSSNQILSLLAPRSKELITIQPLDSRPDDEIIRSLQNHQPITSENNVWAFWDSGFIKMPPWNRRNVVNWIRRLGPSWTVRVLDLVEGSPTNIAHFVDSSYLPQALNSRTMTGAHVGPHSSDIIRLPCLYLYGGVWLDVGTFLFRHLDKICWETLIDPETPYDMGGFSIEFRPGIGMMYNGFIAARKGSGFIKRWHDIYLEVWKNVTDSSGMHEHPLLQHLPGFQPPVEKLSASNLTVDYGQFLDYLSHNLCFERLRHLRDPSDGWDGPKYYERNILFFDAMQETYYAQKITEWDGTKQFQLLATERNGTLESEAYREAEAFVEDVLTHSSTMKLSHGLPSGKEYLAALWDKPENHEEDVRPGTFASYLRYGSVYLEQTRSLTPLLMPPTTDNILCGGVTEVVGEKSQQ